MSATSSVETLQTSGGPLSGAEEEEDQAPNMDEGQKEITNEVSGLTDQPQGTGAGSILQNMDKAASKPWSGPEEFSKFAACIIKILINRKEVKKLKSLPQPLPIQLDITANLEIIAKRNDQKMYKDPASLLKDVSRIYQRMLKHLKVGHEATMVAKKVILLCKTNICDLELCRQCFLRANSGIQDWFLRVCDKPHPVVMAKVRGFPYWPAKVIVRESNNIKCWFFGTHDKSVVTVNSMKYLNADSLLPNPNRKRKQKLTEALDELKAYLENYKKKFGELSLQPTDNTTVTWENLQVQLDTVPIVREDFEEESIYPEQDEETSMDSQEGIEERQNLGEAAQKRKASENPDGEAANKIPCISDGSLKLQAMRFVDNLTVRLERVPELESRIQFFATSYSSPQDPSVVPSLLSIKEEMDPQTVEPTAPLPLLLPFIKQELDEAINPPELVIKQDTDAANYEEQIPAVSLAQEHNAAEEAHHELFLNNVALKPEMDVEAEDAQPEIEEEPNLPPPDDENIDINIPDAADETINSSLYDEFLAEYEAKIGRLDYKEQCLYLFKELRAFKILTGLKFKRLNEKFKDLSIETQKVYRSGGRVELIEERKELTFEELVEPHRPIPDVIPHSFQLPEGVFRRISPIVRCHRRDIGVHAGLDESGGRLRSIHVHSPLSTVRHHNPVDLYGSTVVNPEMNNTLAQNYINLINSNSPKLPYTPLVNFQNYPCKHCGRVAFLVCCHLGFYCSEACQMEDWEKHGQFCNRIMPPPDFLNNNFLQLLPAILTSQAPSASAVLTEALEITEATDADAESSRPTSPSIIVPDAIPPQ